MCGIAGILQPSVDQAKLYALCTSMVNTIVHRGPDGMGIVSQPGVAFGHVRLAIVELTDAGAQPMRSASGRTLIVFNGEIYNYKTLRQELLTLGHTFRTNSDTEVLLVAYETWGELFIQRLNGIFSFAIYDHEKNRVILARDRLGIKPLYWKRATDSIFFGSEIKAIAAAQQESLSIDRHGLLEFLSFQNQLGHRTIFEGIDLFPAGNLAVIALGDLSVRQERFWSASVRASTETEQQSRERLDSVLRASVVRQMAADVPVNSFLSGGIDSCAIASLASLSAGRIKTFTCGFGISDVTETERQFDERQTAELVAARLGSEHYETVLNADDFLARMHDWAWHAEEPRVGSSFPNFCISDLASRFTKVCMSGTGGDELFAGYPWRYHAAQVAPDWDVFSQQYFSFWHRMMSTEQFKALTMPLGVKEFDSFTIFREQLAGARSRVLESSSPMADSALIFEAETFLQGLLIVEDKASMAHGLEVRVPLLDNDLIDVALSTPIAFKLATSDHTIKGAYGSQGVGQMPAFANGKKILRDVLAGYVPSEVTSGRKQGFSPPFETWFRKGLKNWLETEVFGSQSHLSDLLDMQVARKIWQEHLNGQQNHRLFIWGMISLHLSVTTFMRRANCGKS